ncbi:hypothetical protein N9E05_06305 [Gammaproteobacteria bacterium]|nr:hypothetical protein [Gammaproteobacteria bacterium]
MFYKFLISAAIFLPSSIHAMDYSALKHNSILSFSQVKSSSIEIQYDQMGKGKNEKIQLFINNILFSQLTNKQKFIITVLPGTYNLDVRKDNNVLEKASKTISGGQTRSWIIPHNRNAKDQYEVEINPI